MIVSVIGEMSMTRKAKTNGLAVLVIGLTFTTGGTVMAQGTPHMSVGGATSQPIGHYEFCRQYPRECSVRTRNIRVTPLTRSRWKQMVEANTYANTHIEPVTDINYYGVEERWAFPKTKGDCEDFALLKRHMLMSQGWPASSLLVTVVRQKNGDGHAVLTVRTDRGDYILDNLEDRIEPWNNTGYTYLKRVSATHSGKWEDIIDTRRLVSSVK